MQGKFNWKLFCKILGFVFLGLAIAGGIVLLCCHPWSLDPANEFDDQVGRYIIYWMIIIAPSMLFLSIFSFGFAYFLPD